MNLFPILSYIKILHLLTQCLVMKKLLNYKNTICDELSGLDIYLYHVTLNFTTNRLQLSCRTLTCACDMRIRHICLCREGH